MTVFMEIRLLRETDDLFAVSQIYEESWKFAYRRLIPGAYLRSIPTGRWVPHLREGKWDTLVLLERGKYVGTSSYCGSRFPEFSGFGEIVSIYLLPSYMGRGYGRSLLNTAVQNLAALGYRDIFLWVLEENRRARAFYERAEFQPGKTFRADVIGGKPVREISYLRHLP